MDKAFCALEHSHKRHQHVKCSIFESLTSDCTRSLRDALHVPCVLLVILYYALADDDLDAPCQTNFPELDLINNPLKHRFPETQAHDKTTAMTHMHCSHLPQSSNKLKYSSLEEHHPANQLATQSVIIRRVTKLSMTAVRDETVSSHHFATRTLSLYTTHNSVSIFSAIKYPTHASFSLIHLPKTNEKKDSHTARLFSATEVEAV